MTYRKLTQKQLKKLKEERKIVEIEYKIISIRRFLKKVAIELNNVISDLEK